MKPKILSMLIPALLAPGAVNAAEVYNKDGHKLDLYGMVDARHTFSDDAASDGDQTYARFGFNGETQVSDTLTGYGRWEYNIQANHSESDGSKDNATRLAFAGLKFGAAGSFDYGRNYGVLYDIASWTDRLPVFGDDTYSYVDNFMASRGNGMATYRNDHFFGLIEGLSFALQYQGKNENDRNGTTQNSTVNGTGTMSATTNTINNVAKQNGDGFGLSTVYDSGVGLSFGGAFTSSDRTLSQKRAVIDVSKPTVQQPGFALGDKAQAWTVGSKYDANNIYLAAMYSETLNMTPYSKNLIANKTGNLEIVAQYQFDFGLRPSLAYLQSKGKDLGATDGTGSKVNNANLVRYVDIAAHYSFNKNMSAYVDYKINLLDDNSTGFAKANGIGTDDVVGVGMVYQF